MDLKLEPSLSLRIVKVHCLFLKKKKNMVLEVSSKGKFSSNFLSENGLFFKLFKKKRLYISLAGYKILRKRVLMFSLLKILIYCVCFY
jgi:hypothetical protein